MKGFRFAFLALVLAVSLSAQAGGKLSVPAQSFKFVGVDGYPLEGVRVEFHFTSFRRYFTLDCPSSGHGISFQVGCHKSKEYKFGRVYTYTSDANGEIKTPALNLKYKAKNPTVSIRIISNVSGKRLVFAGNTSKRCELWERGQKNITNIEKNVSCKLIEIKPRKQEQDSGWDILWNILG